MVVKFSGNDNVVRYLQSLKAPVPMLVTVEGNVNLVRAVFAKASWPMDVS